MEITKVYALDAVFDTPEDVPEDVTFANMNFAIALHFSKCL